jgi:phospholipid/cholesterol/gamma-HCH transport system ATP-binding protein
MKAELNYNECVIFIKGLYKSFGKLDILKNVNLEIFKGENIAILGKSGSGKSVLIKILVGLLAQDKGEVKVFGEDVNKLTLKQLNNLRLKIGFSFQNSALYDSMNVRQNIEFPLTMNRAYLTRKEVNFLVDEVLDSVALKEKALQMPSELSGGQRKRIGIARTLILKPEIMLYDEPTSGLDPTTSQEINLLINSVQKQYNTTSIIITHDLTCAKQTSNRVAVLFDGSFVKIGEFDEVFKTKNEQIQSFYNYNFIQ